MNYQKGSLPLIVLVLITFIGLSLFFFLGKIYQKSVTLIPSPFPQTTPSQMGLRFDFSPGKSDPFNDLSGPFYHQVFLSNSPDGVNFTKGELLFDKASAPDIVRLPNGRLLAYMVDGAGRSKSGIIVALSDDNGKSWDIGSLQLKNRKSTGTADPEVILTRSGNIKLFYVSFLGKNNAVMSAVSEDGVNFEEEEGIRFQYPQITDPDLIFINDKWFMYLSQGSKLIATSSDDGLTFKSENTIREKGSVSNTVYVDVDFYRQFYCFEGKIKSAKTSDGLNFQDEPGFRLEPDKGKAICDPAPVHLGGSWLMLYKVSNH
ncbi:hypothetical protein A2769_04565 [Candidatus Daviesbacteria bacterium RIFCSPHIGHO2_01_FULL_37_27]|nr:MAG: hypothetical protein A2769_04565 [Candidatus Daviesbacteria bacterium RIFCSPHIGHO2_01_FULL_37_27]OGE46054.1 MAG: hypothetical protein A3B39_03545 [Candidatus Daviesbacteria bacterium RIFCSPLOWO2_01_FULL_37_10]